MWLLYGWDRANELQLHIVDATAMARLQAEGISSEMQAVNSDLLFLAEEETMLSYLSNPVAARRDEVAEQFRRFCARKGIYDQIRFLDDRGMERIRVNNNGGHPTVVAETDLQPKGTRYYFDRSFRVERYQTYVSPFDLNVEHGVLEEPVKPMIRFATAVFDAQGSKRGILVLNFLGARLLRQMDEAASGFAGLVTLVNADGYWLKGPQPADDWGFMYGRPPTFSTSHATVWHDMASAPRGHVLCDDGLYAFDTVPWLDNSYPGLKVVTWVPREELQRRSNLLLRRLLVIDGVVFVLLAAFAWSLAQGTVARQRDQRQIEASEGRLRTMSLRLIHAQEEERQSISRDLHDDLGQGITAIALHLERALAIDDPVKRATAVERALEATRDVLQRVHDISQRLRPRILDELGLHDALRSYLSDVHAHSGLDTHAHIELGGAVLPMAVSECFYRIVQEATTNVLKHARATRVEVTLRVEGGRALLCIEDDGVGMRLDDIRDDALGILDMRERAELLGGAFDLTSKPGEGTRIEVGMPLHASGKETTGHA